MCSGRAMEAFWEIFVLDLSWAIWLGSWLEISRRAPTRQSRRAGGWKMEWKGTQSYRPARIQHKNFPESLHSPSRAHTQLPLQQISIMCTQPHSCFKLYPITSPSTHPSNYPSNHPYQSPTITPSTCPIPTPSHTWAIQGRFGRPHGSHLTCIQG